jgi:hypothetical protein
MSEKTFVPNGSTFIGNITSLNTQFSANVIADAPTTYLRVTNFGDTSGGGLFTAIWVKATANTAPQVVDFAAAADPAWSATNNGTLVAQGETVIVGIDNGVGAKRVAEIQFVANADPTSSGTHALLAVQPIIPV